MRRFCPRPSYVLIFILCAFAYAGALFPALVVAAFFLWMFGPALIVGQVVRDIRRIAQAQARR